MSDSQNYYSGTIPQKLSQEKGLLPDKAVITPSVQEIDRGGFITRYILPLCTLLLIGRPQDLIPFIGNLRPGYLLFFILTGILLFGPRDSSKTRYLNYTNMKFTLIFIVLIYISILWAEIGSTTFEFLLLFLTIPVYFLCLCKCLRSMDDIKRQIWLLSVIILWYSFLSFKKGGSMDRVFVGQMYDPNELALIMVMSIPFIYYLFGQTKGIIKKSFLTATLTLALITIVLTKSRGGFLGMTSLLVLFFFFKTRIRSSRFALGKILIICMVPFVFSMFVSDAYWERINTIFGSDNGSGRTGVWVRAMEIIQEKPFTGVGVSNFTSSYGFRLKAGKFKHMPSNEEWMPNAWVTAHNSFILVATELGIPGVIAFLVILWDSIRSLRRLRKDAFVKGNDDVFSLSGMLIMSLMAFIICAFFLSFAYQAFLYFFVGISVSLRKVFEETGMVNGGYLKS